MKATSRKLLVLVVSLLQPLTEAFTPLSLLQRVQTSAKKSLSLPTPTSHHDDRRRPSPWAIAHVAPAYNFASSRLSAGLSPDPELIIGYLMIAAASTPYVLSLFFPNFFLKNFFLPVYTDDKDGRDAEIGWKTRYATLAFVLTTLVGLELWLAPARAMSSFTVLRDSYIAWAIFYTGAFLKIRREAKEGIIAENPVGIQVWHFLVVFVLWADVSRSPLAQAVLEWIKRHLLPAKFP